MTPLTIYDRAIVLFSVYLYRSFVSLSGLKCVHTSCDSDKQLFKLLLKQTKDKWKKTTSSQKREYSPARHTVQKQQNCNKTSSTFLQASKQETVIILGEKERRNKNCTKINVIHSCVRSFLKHLACLSKNKKKTKNIASS